MQDDRPRADQILDGYRLIRRIGRGGFGEVWLCRSESMGGWHAFKFVPSDEDGGLDKEFQALALYRTEAARLRSPALIAIEHVNRTDGGLYYVMPLADGMTGCGPKDADWKPFTLAAFLEQRKTPGAVWPTSAEIISMMRPILEGLQLLADVGLVHRDVKPDNILFFRGSPCLGDIGLLGEDAGSLTRRGTPGYAGPSWYVGGHADMYGAAATLYSLLTGNPPDKIGRSAFLWPPGGEHSLSSEERKAWRGLHEVVRRAIEEKVAERYVDFRAMASALGNPSDHTPPGPVWKSRLARTIITGAAFAGTVAAAMFSAFRGHPERGDVTTGQPGNAAAGSLPELTPQQKADYQALAGMIEGYIGDGNYANALASVETLLSTYPQARSQPAYSIARAMALEGLGRIDEAKAELRKDVHLSPQIHAMNTRKEMWEKFGELDSAEKDITRIIDKFGASTLPLFLRADIRAQRGDFAGVQADHDAALKVGDDPEQPSLVEAMWKPLKKKYPDYGKYLNDVKKE